MEGPSAESLELWASKVQGDWAAPTVASQLTQERLQGLAIMFRKGKLENMVKVRLLLACLFLPRFELESLHTELEALSAAACDDEDEWVRVTGAAVGDYCGQLDTAALIDGGASSALVSKTLNSLWTGLEGAKAPAHFRPLQELLMHPEVLSSEALEAQRGGGGAHSHSHFTPRGPVPEGGVKYPLAPPPLAQLLDGTAMLGGAVAAWEGGKGEHQRRMAAQASAASAMMFRPSNIAAAAAAAAAAAPTAFASAATRAPSIASNTLAAAAAAAHPPHHEQVEDIGGVGGGGAGAGLGSGRTGSTLGVRSSKLKPLELSESLQLQAQASAQASARGPPRSAQQLARAMSVATPGPATLDGAAPPLQTAARPTAMDVDTQPAEAVGPASDQGVLQHADVAGQPDHSMGEGQGEGVHPWPQEGVQGEANMDVHPVGPVKVRNKRQRQETEAMQEAGRGGAEAGACQGGQGMMVPSATDADVNEEVI